MGICVITKLEDNFAKTSQLITVSTDPAGRRHPSYGDKNSANLVAIVSISIELEIISSTLRSDSLVVAENADTTITMSGKPVSMDE
jgi:hypothetical protein